MNIVKKQIQYNFTNSRGRTIEYIVIHDTGNSSNGANAEAHYRYFNGGNRNASADFFVDDTNIVQTNDYKNQYTWAVGDGRGRNGITNANSLSIEICINADGDYNKAIQNTIELVKSLMNQLNLSINRVVRHHDASGKNCPASMSANSWEKWNWFKSQLVKQPEVSIPSPTSQPQQTTQTRVVEGVAYCTVGTLNVRNGGSTNYPIQGVLNLNEKVAILEKSYDWRVVRYYNAPKGKYMEGWVNANYLRITQDVQVITETVNQSSYGTVTADVLNIRSDRGTQYPIIGKLKQGDKVKLLYLKDKWWSIDVPLNVSSSGVGFIHSDYVK